MNKLTCVLSSLYKSNIFRGQTRQMSRQLWMDCLHRNHMTSCRHHCISSTLSNVPLFQVSMANYASLSHIDEVTGWMRFKQRFGIKGKLRYPKQKLQLSGYNMYACCQSLVDFEQMMKDLDLPDTFNSWFLITDLHVWLCMLRLAQLGEDGKVVRNGLVSAMWSDLEKRSKQLGNAASLSSRQEGIRELGNIFYGSLFAYDEGILGDDRMLAGAIWRHLFEMKDKKPEQLSLMVDYIRRQVLHLDHQNSYLIFRKGVITFTPLYKKQINTQEVNKKLFKIFSQDILS